MPLFLDCQIPIQRQQQEGLKKKSVSFLLAYAGRLIQIHLHNPLNRNQVFYAGKLGEQTHQFPVSSIKSKIMTGLSENHVPEITVQELKHLVNSNQDPFILDVREEHEYLIANLGGHLIPLKQLADRIDELRKHQYDDLIVVHCRSGGRSAQAVRFLNAAGYTNVKNLRGRTLAWSKEIDPSLPTY